MKIGLQIPFFTWPGGPAQIGSTFAEIGRTADAAGFHSIWVMDHFFQLEPMLGKAEEPMLEGYSALSFLAGLTKNVKLGTLVTGVIYRQPSLLVKEVTTLDVLSGGRAYLGIGAAWYDREAEGLGFPFPPTKERFEWLEEALQIAHHMWQNNRTPYTGKHFQMKEPICSPLPVSQPHPPIMIGGMGEKKTLRLVAQYANACNLFAMMGYDLLKQKLEVLQAHCEELGRPFNDIERTCLATVNITTGGQSAEDVIKTCRELADIGIQHAIFNMPNAHEITPLEVFGKEIIPAVAGF